MCSLYTHSLGSKKIKHIYRNFKFQNRTLLITHRSMTINYFNISSTSNYRKLIIICFQWRWMLERYNDNFHTKMNICRVVWIIANRNALLIIHRPPRVKFEKKRCRKLSCSVNDFVSKKGLESSFFKFIIFVFSIHKFLVKRF